MRLTLQDVYDSRIPSAVGLCAGDPKLLAYINEATQRLLYEGKWWGSYQKYNICTNQGCVTLPRQIATIEAIAMCGRPMQLRDMWFEFLENGAGTRNGCSCFNEAISRGNYCVFSDIIPLGKKLLFICDLASDVGTQVLALGYDDNNNWIRTVQNGTMSDGELITLAQGAGTLSVNNFSVITDIQLPVRNGQCWLYEWNVAAGTPRMIGQYQYDETRPSYARYFFPSIQRLEGQCCGNTPIQIANPSAPLPFFVEIIGKLDFIPVRNPTDYLIITSIPALKEMIVALNNAEKEDNGVTANQLIESGLMLAKQQLDAQLDHFLGSGRRIGIQLVGSSIGSVEPVYNFI